MVDYITDAGAFGAREDYWIFQARNQIRADYGLEVSITQKAKALIKFGHGVVGASAYQTLFENGPANETYPTTNSIDSISSTSGADVGIQIAIEYHTLTGSGTSAKFTFGVQYATLNGQTRVALSTPCARVSRIYNNSGTEFAGTIYVYENTALTGGAPVDTSKIHCTADASDQQSEKAATTISDGDFWLIGGFAAGIDEKTSGRAHVSLQVRDVGKVFRERYQVTADGASNLLRPMLIVPRNADYRCRAIASTTNVGVAAIATGILAKVI